MCSILSRTYDAFLPFEAACAPSRLDYKSNINYLGKKAYGEFLASDEGMATNIAACAARI